MRSGRIELAVGPMFSGKSEWLVGKLRVHKIAKDNILAIKYSKDTRYGKRKITSHNLSSFKAKSASSVKDIQRIVKKNGLPHVLAIDEIQFFEPALAEYILSLQVQGVYIYTTGLDLDFAQKPWETTMKVMAYADHVEKKVAVCSVCNKVNATRTQRLINGKPASKSSPRVLIAGLDSYTARCPIHHQMAP